MLLFSFRLCLEQEVNKIPRLRLRYFCIHTQTFIDITQSSSLTSPESLLKTTKIITKVLSTKINGTVTNVQKGQQGPAAIIGLPSFLSSKKKNEPTLRAQQQKYL